MVEYKIPIDYYIEMLALEFTIIFMKLQWLVYDIKMSLHHNDKFDITINFMTHICL